jgi:para-nitrobenzyl esterase
MVFGQSGGGAKTSAILGMPAAKGLFHKAGIQSGAMLRGGTKEAATETALRVLAGLGLGPKDSGKLAEMPLEKLLALQFAGEKGPLGVPSKDWQSRPHGKERPGSFGPMVDGTVLPANPYDPVATAISAEIPLLIGNTRDEATFGLRDNPNLLPPDEAGLLALGRPFLGDAMQSIIDLYRRTRPQATLGERVIAIMTAVQFGNDTVRLADLKSQQPAPVYRYRYDYQSNAPIKGTDWTFRAGHATDISLVFNNEEILDLQGNGPGLTEAALAMSSYFASFARHGVPSVPHQPAWPRYDIATRATMLLNSQCAVVNDPDSEERQFWQRMGM